MCMIHSLREGNAPRTINHWILCLNFIGIAIVRVALSCHAYRQGRVSVSIGHTDKEEMS